MPPPGKTTAAPTAAPLPSPFASLIARAPTKLKPRRALLVIDCQEGFLRPSGPMPGSAELTTQIAKNIRKLLPSFRRSGGDVLWIKTEYKESRDSRTAEKSAHTAEIQDKLGLLSADVCSDDGGSDTGTGSKTPITPAELIGEDKVIEADDGSPLLKDPDAFLSKKFASDNKGFLTAGSESANFVSEITKFIEPTDRTITKTCYSAFEEGSLVLTLRSRMVTELYIAGANTNSSIFATVSDASRYGFMMWVLSDCVSYTDKERHENACSMMKNNFGVDQLRTVELLIKVVEGKGEHKEEAAQVVGEEMIANPTVDEETLEKLVESLKISENNAKGTATNSDSELEEEDDEDAAPRAKQKSHPMTRPLSFSASIAASLKALELEVGSDDDEDEDSDKEHDEFLALKAKILKKPSALSYLMKRPITARSSASKSPVEQKPPANFVQRSASQRSKDTATNNNKPSDQKDVAKAKAPTVTLAAAPTLKKEVPKEPDKDKVATKAQIPDKPQPKTATEQETKAPTREDAKATAKSEAKVESKSQPLAKLPVSTKVGGQTAVKANPQAAAEPAARAKADPVSALASAPTNDSEPVPAPRQATAAAPTPSAKDSTESETPPKQDQARPASQQRVERKPIVVRRRISVKKPEPTATPNAATNEPSAQKVKPSEAEKSNSEVEVKAENPAKTSDSAPGKAEALAKSDDSNPGNSETSVTPTAKSPVIGVADDKVARTKDSGSATAAGVVTNKGKNDRDSCAKPQNPATEEIHKEATATTTSDKASKDNISSNINDNTESQKPRSETMPKRESAENIIDPATQASNNNAPQQPPRRKKNVIPGTFVGPGELIGELEDGSKIIPDILPPELAVDAFERLKEEVRWRVMYHRGGEVPRLVAVEGEISEDGSFPIYRHPADESPPLLPFSRTVSEIRKHVEKALGHPVNHVLIQYYRGGMDYISEHSDKTLDIVQGSYICNVSLGAQRVMTLRTKKPYKNHQKKEKNAGYVTATPAADEVAEGDEARDIQRVKLLHNSLFVLGLVTNRKWTHAIKQDRRPTHLKNPHELAYNGERISLTFRQIGTFLSKDERKIWGQGAKSKEKSSAGEAICGDEEKAQELIYAFAAENGNPDFVWSETYGKGFDVLHFTPQLPQIYTLAAHDDGNSVEFMRLHPSSLSIKIALVELGLNYREQALKMSDLSDKHFAEVSPRQRTPVFVDVDPSRTVVIGEAAILNYIASTTRPSNAQQVGSPEMYTQLLPDPKKDQCEFGRVLSGFSELPGLLELTQKISVFPLTQPYSKLDKVDDSVLEEAKEELKNWNKYFWKKAPSSGKKDEQRSFTIFDCALVPLLAHLVTGLGGAVDITEYETLKGYFEAARTRESVRKVLGEDIFDFSKKSSAEFDALDNDKEEEKSAEERPMEDKLAQKSPVQEVPVEEKPTQRPPAEEKIAKETLVENEPVDKTQVQDEPTKEKPAETAKAIEPDEGKLRTMPMIDADSSAETDDSATEDDGGGVKLVL